MRTKVIASLLVLLFATTANSALISRIKTFVDGEILTAADLNAEFNGVVDGVNSINDANIVTGASINPNKISATIAGSGISRNSTTGVLSCAVDDSTIEISSNALRVKDSGITSAKILDATIQNGDLASNAVTSAKILDGTIATADLADSLITSAKISDGTIAAADIASGAVDSDEIATGAVTAGKHATSNYQISSSTGSFTTTSTSFVDVTNATVTITTSGRPVLVFLQSDGSGNYGYIGKPGVINDIRAGFRLVRDATEIAQFQAHVDNSAESPGLSFPPGSVHHLDTPAAGTYTYKLQSKTSDAGQAAATAYVKLVAIEVF